MKTVRFQNGRQELVVGKILCLGRNYAAHAREMGAAVPENPVVFLKPSTAIVYDGGTVVIPSFSSDVHHEVEMVIVVGHTCRDVPAAEARSCIAGYAVGLDMTLRDVQAAAKKAGLPWTIAKGFDTSAPLSDAVERERVSAPQALPITLSVNGTVRQQSDTSLMLLGVDRIVSYLSTVFTLEPGDLIYTGTPEGVAAVRPGDVLAADLGGIARLTVRVAAQEGVTARG